MRAIYNFTKTKKFQIFNDHQTGETNISKQENENILRTMQVMRTMNDSDVYYWGSCPICKRNESLKVCGRCKLVYYCSKEHQKINWRVHKSFCNSVHRMLVAWKIESVFSNAYKFSSTREWNDIRTRAALFSELTLGRKLIPFERQMFLFPRVCEVCKSDNQKILKNCDRCLCVSYCSDFHQVEDIQHTDKCSLLKLCKHLDTSVNDTSYITCLDVISSVHCSYNTNLENMEVFLKKISFPTENNDLQLQKILFSELISCPLTLLYFIQHIEREYCIKDELMVHIVGASNLECCVANVWNIIPHWLTNIHKLHIVFIGPDIVHQENNSCSCYNGKENKNVYLEFHKTFYHDYIQSQGHTHPHIIVSFNCGFHEYKGSANDTWDSTLPCFFKFPGINIIITSYTNSEAIKDRNVLMSFSQNKADILFDCIDNPFSSSRPHRDWDQIRSDVFFINKYASVVHVN